MLFIILIPSPNNSTKTLPMPSTLRKSELDEISAGTLQQPIPSRMQRLRNLLSGGPWSPKSIVMLYWKPDPQAPGGGQWVAWEDSTAPKVDPLPEAGVTIA
jgi:hypothetical protein